MATSEWLKPLFTPEEIRGNFEEYVKDKWWKHKDPIILSWFCIEQLWCSRHYLTQIEEGKNWPEYSATLKKVKDYIEKDKHQWALAGAYNTAFTIFDLKNNSNWKDKQEITQTNINQVSEDDLED